MNGLEIMLRAMMGADTFDKTIAVVKNFIDSGKLAKLDSFVDDMATMQKTLEEIRAELRQISAQGYSIGGTRTLAARLAQSDLELDPGPRQPQSERPIDSAAGNMLARGRTDFGAGSVVAACVAPDASREAAE